MLMTDEWLDILKHAEELSEMLLSSDMVATYRKARNEIYADKQLASEIGQFVQLKEQYEEVQRFGKYHPDYNHVMKLIRKKKRALDMDERIATLRIAENDIQHLLDEISVIIAHAVSKSIKVPSGNPFFASSCAGGCGSGGSCSCSA